MHKYASHRVQLYALESLVLEETKGEEYYQLIRLCLYAELQLQVASQTVMLKRSFYFCHQCFVSPSLTK